MAGHVDRVGQQVGEYRLLRWLGSGGFGDVYLAEHLREHTQAAVKILQARLTRHDDLKEFINEARTIRLKHLHIVSLLDFGIASDDTPFLVMTYAPHGTLRDRHPKGSRLPLSIIVSYVRPLASALQYAHSLHLVHRDVKPENMLVGPSHEVLLSDFGIVAVAHSSRSLSTENGIGGTLPYMAPEQIAGKPRAASDQYALGIVVYEWITGRRPFTGTAAEIALQLTTTPPPSLREQLPTLPVTVEQVVMKALSKDPKSRFANIEEFAWAFEQASQQIEMPRPPVEGSPSIRFPLPVQESVSARLATEQANVRNPAVTDTRFAPMSAVSFSGVEEMALVTQPVDGTVATPTIPLTIPTLSRQESTPSRLPPPAGIEFPQGLRRRPILMLMSIAVASAVIISSVVGFLITRVAEPATYPHALGLRPSTLVVTPSTLDFGELERSVKLTLPISISNTGGQPLSWTLTEDAGSTKWLAVQTRSATIGPKDPQQQDKVTVDTSSLPLGTSFAYLMVNSNDGARQVTVKVDVLPPGTPRLNIIPTSLDFGTQAIAMPVPQQKIIVINGGTKVLKWQANPGNAGWLTLDKNSRTSWMLQSGGQQAINVAVNTGLKPGTYSATVTITAPGAQGSPATVGITLTVVSPCTLVLSPSSLAFTVQQGQSAPAAQNLNFHESGACALPVTWTASGDSASSGWLNFSPASGADSGNGATVSVSVNPPATGTYSGTITISASDSGGGTVQGGSQMVAVTLTVTGINISGVLNACTDSTCATSAPLAGASFALLDSTGTHVANVVTDGSGNYVFSNLALGSYTMSVTDSTNNHYIAGTLFTVSGDQTGVAVNVYPG